MYSFVFGLPGSFSRWCAQVVAALVERAGGSDRLLCAETLEAFARHAIENHASDAAVCAHRPGGRLRAAVIESGRRFVVAIADPRTVLAELAFGQEVGLADAVQQIASSCAALRGLAAAPGALALHHDRDWPRPAETAAAIAEHIGLRIDAGVLPELLARVAASIESERPYDAAVRWAALSLDQQALARGALASFVDDGDEPGAAAQIITWGPELFYVGDLPHQRLVGLIDITGRARCLVQGPDILLPAGSWSLSLTAQFRRGAAEHEFAVDVSADQPLASGMFRPEREGSASITLDFALDDLNERPVALRLSSRRAAFDGTIHLIAATLVSLPVPPTTAATAAAAATSTAP